MYLKCFKVYQPKRVGVTGLCGWKFVGQKLNTLGITGSDCSVGLIEKAVLELLTTNICFYFLLSGLFGFIVLSLLLIPMYFIFVGDFSNNPRHVLEDAIDAFCQIGHRPLIIVALLGNTVSIAFFNFAGISVTKEISATTRMVLDSLRTLVIWVVSLALGWEQFQGLQVLGFLVLLLGTALYNGLHRPLLARIPWCAARMALEDSSSAERERLLNDGSVQSADT